jgi:putative hemolysin
MEILIIFFLILLNGVFSMSEMALVSSRKIRLENAAKKGSKQAKEALKLANNPGKFLSTVQIGITLIGILTGIYSGEKITRDLQSQLDKIGFLQGYSDTIAVVLVLLILTFFSLVLGELVPKKIGLSSPERISKMMARPMRIISIIAAPFVWTLTFTTDLIVKVLGIKNSSDSAVTEEEIKAIVQEGTTSGEVQEIEQDIVGRVFSLGDRKISSLMTHRTDLILINTTDTREEIIEKIKDAMHSVYPVYDEVNKKVVGVIQLKQIFLKITESDFNLNHFTHSASYLPENSSAYDALHYFKQKKINYAIVTDEFGHAEGIITLNDILEALAGNAEDFDFDEPGINQRDDGTWLVDGQYVFADFLHYFDMEDFMAEYTFNTLSGLILEQTQQIPTEGDKIRWNNFEFEIIDMDGARIDKILIKKID